jgi:hypothetical protein
MASIDFDQALKILGLLGALGSFAFAVVQWKAKSKSELAQAETESRRLAATRQVEATKPFLERQLKLYTEATQVAAVVSTSEVPEARATARRRFWELYWGELALVENPEVEAAMVQLGDALEKDTPQSELQKLSLKLAQACRTSLDQSWGIHAWSSPDKATRTQ